MPFYVFRSTVESYDPSWPTIFGEMNWQMFFRLSAREPRENQAFDIQAHLCSHNEQINSKNLIHQKYCEKTFECAIRMFWVLIVYTETQFDPHQKTHVVIIGFKPMQAKSQDWRWLCVLGGSKDFVFSQ